MRHVITVDLGPLLQPLQAHCQARQERPSDVVRRALARELNQPIPVLRGQVANLRQYRRKKP
jgi:hypothetical protein